MKKIFIGLVWTCVSLTATAQANNYDTLAVLIFDRMSGIIGDMESCSFKLNVANDVAETAGLVKQFTDYEVYLEGPDKMLITAQGFKGHRQFYYNGKYFAHYSYDENNYGILKTPGNTIETIDHLHKNYGIDFPAADFFYPTFTDDMLELSDSIRFLGMVQIRGKEYYTIMAYSEKINVQFWINNDAYNLPGKFVITYKDKPGSPQYAGAFSEWQINPVFPVSMFEFIPPPGAKEVRILSNAEITTSKR
jgi:hypothetical protein